jgi:hypothetical protein
MKKTYITPCLKTLTYDSEAVLAASGPGGGDAILPGMTEDGDDGPGADDHGNTPGYGAKFNNHSIWED